MIVTYARSSSLGAFALCEHKYLLNYVLGVKEPPNISANVGNACHKGLEIRAREKLARQNGHPTFVEPETGREFKVGSADPDTCIDHGWQVYFPGEPKKGVNFAKVSKLFHNVLTHKLYDPAHLDIVQPEQFFDLEIPHDWAKLDFVDPHTGKRVTGQLAIKGTVDLLAREAPGLLHYVDWKTGRKWDWVKQKPKDFESLLDDVQLMLYYYALRRLYPKDEVLMTIYFVGVDGPTTLPYSDEHVERAVRMLRANYEAIASCQKPTRRMTEVGPFGQPCSFCSYNKVKMPNGKSTCTYYWDELQTLGLDKLIKKHGKPNVFSAYGDGGGQSKREAGE